MASWWKSTVTVSSQSGFLRYWSNVGGVRSMVPLQHVPHSQSGKLVQKMFDKIQELIDDPDAMVCVLIDEVMT